MIRRRTVLASALTASAALGMTACGKSDAPASGSTSSTPSGASDGGGAGALSSLVVTGKIGEEPTVSFPTPLQVKNPQSRMLVTGTGEKISKGDYIALNTVYLNAENGKVLQSYWKGAPANYLAVDQAANGAQATNFLLGAHVGGRFAMAGRVPTQQGELTVVQVSDIVSRALRRAQGRSVPIPDGLPRFDLTPQGAPRLLGKPQMKAPESTVSAVTIEGTGPTTAVGDTLAMQYTGWKLSNGEEFDSSWKRGEPFSFTLGRSEVIAGWDSALRGKKVGSQVLLVIPPDQAYGPATTGASSTQPAHPLAGQTLIFVADILGAAKPASR